jgi:hypothetical protein
MGAKTGGGLHARQSTAKRASEPVTLFGVPVGDLGWFASLLMGTATGFAAFFAATFFGIVYVLICNSAGHQTLDYSLSYKRIGLPAGILVLMVSLGYLGLLWVRRMTRRA